jgi:hypothetical protein
MGLLRRLELRPTFAALAFLLAVVALVWPIHYRAASGVTLYGRANQFTLTAFSTQTCPWLLQLGHRPSTIPTTPPPNSNATAYLVSSYNDGACAAKRYDRTSQALLFLLVGFGLTISAMRRAREQAPSRPTVPAAV